MRIHVVCLKNGNILLTVASAEFNCLFWS